MRPSLERSQQLGRYPQDGRLTVAVSGESCERHVFLGARLVPSANADVAHVALRIDLGLQSLPSCLDDRDISSCVQHTTPNPRDHGVGEHGGTRALFPIGWVVGHIEYLIPKTVIALH